MRGISYLWEVERKGRRKDATNDTDMEKALTTVWDFTGVYEEMGMYETLEGLGYDFDVVGMRDAAGTGCYCDAAAAEQIRRQMADRPYRGVHWLDSGDYHYLTRFYVERFEVPYTLLVVDNHTDRQAPAFPGVLSCGSWMRELEAEDPFQQGVVTIGPGHRTETSGMPDLGGNVYLSLDKDVLSREYARTDWDQGTYSLPEVMALVREACRSARVLGADVCGEIPRAKGGTPEDLRVNLSTNLSLQRFLFDFFATFGE